MQTQIIDGNAKNYQFILIVSAICWQNHNPESQPVRSDLYSSTLNIYVPLKVDRSTSI